MGGKSRSWTLKKKGEIKKGGAPTEEEKATPHLPKRKMWKGWGNGYMRTEKDGRAFGKEDLNGGRRR